MTFTCRLTFSQYAAAGWIPFPTPSTMDKLFASLADFPGQRRVDVWDSD